MKKILLFLSILYFSGCYPGSIESQKLIIIKRFDFTKYSKKGFLFTPEKIIGNYESIGMVEVDIYPEFKSFATSTNAQNWMPINVSTDEVIDSLYSVCNKMGANALTNFKIGNTEPVRNGDKIYYGIRANGFAIKR